MNRLLYRKTAAAGAQRCSKASIVSRAQVSYCASSPPHPFLRQQLYNRFSSSAKEGPTESSTYTPVTPTATITIPPSANDQDIRVKISPLGNGITHVLLSRPSKLNSLDMPMFESVASAASQLKQDRNCRVVILSGEGRAFCTGLDAKSVAFEGKALERLLDRPSGYGGENGVGNLAQDVGYLWRYASILTFQWYHAFEVLKMVFFLQDNFRFPSLQYCMECVSVEVCP